METQIQTATPDATPSLSTTEEPTATPVLFADLAVHDTILFGTYEQDNDASNGREKIQWLVLEIEDNRALLISKDA